MQLIRTAIVDDERLARKRIRQLLETERDVEVVAEFANGREASEKLGDLRPDLLFLDVQMPSVDGFEVLTRMGPSAIPAVVFVTAYEQYAVRAFEVAARDYLLKPFDEVRFRAAVQRAREALQEEERSGLEERLLRLLESGDKARGSKSAVLVREGSRSWFVDVGEIDWIESGDNYARLHVGEESHLVRETMAAFEDSLRASRFARIHRSIIVNLDRVAEFQQWFNGDYLVVLKNGRKLRMSRNYRGSVQDVLGRSI